MGLSFSPVFGDEVGEGPKYPRFGGDDDRMSVAFLRFELGDDATLSDPTDSLRTLGVTGGDATNASLFSRSKPLGGLLDMYVLEAFHTPCWTRHLT